MHAQNHSKQTIKLPQITALYIGAVLGSGILIIPGLAAELSGPASLLAWGLMSVLVLPMALTMGLLSARYPNTGGVSYFVTKAFNPGIGSLVGWFFLMSVVAGAPVAALTGAGYVCAAMGLRESERILLALLMLLTGLIINFFGIKITGKLQLGVVIIILVIFAITITGSLGKISPTNFEPFMPKGWLSVGQSMVILFWCFLGWEAVSHMSGEFEDPEKTAIKATIIAAVVVSVIYFLTAYVVVGTKSYGANISDVSLVYVIKGTFGSSGALVAGFCALCVCLAPVIAYVGAASRLAYSLSMNGYGPKQFSVYSKKYQTPVGGLLFLLACFIIILAAYRTGAMPLSTLIEIPNTTFLLTYFGGCAAGIRLLKSNKFGVTVSAISLLLTATIFFFVDWPRVFLYPVMIFLVWLYYHYRRIRHTAA